MNCIDVIIRNNSIPYFKLKKHFITILQLVGTYILVSTDFYNNLKKKNSKSLTQNYFNKISHFIKFFKKDNKNT